MSRPSGVPVIVVGRREDDVEAISRALRNAGQAAHCQWVRETRSLGEVLGTGRAQLLFVVTDDEIDRLLAANDLRDRYAPGLPVLAVGTEIDEKSITRAVVGGAQDLVSLADPLRLSAVAIRELRGFATLSELREARAETQALRQQLSTLIDEAADAILYVSEGILASVNSAWLELFGYADATDLIGTPMLDLFAQESRAAIKGAVVACGAGKWAGHRISVKALGSDGGSLSVEAEIDAAQFDGESCVRISMQPETTTVVTPSLAEHRHPVTGLLLRQHFVEKLEEALGGPAAPGVTVLAYMKPDDMEARRDLLDPVVSDQLMHDLALMLKAAVKPNDIYGQFGGDIFMVLLSRGTLRDARAWADDLQNSIRGHVFDVGEKSVPMTCTVGLAQYDAHNDDVLSLMGKAQQAFREGREDGGDSVVLLEKDGSIDRGASTVPVERVKLALMNDGFRLVFQPVASMMGKTRRMFDVLIRMLAEDGTEIMPGDFLPVARQNGLMKTIDRWVIGNGIVYCRKDREAKLFIRLSEESIPDRTLIPWLEKQLEAYKASSSQLVFQVTEQNAEEHLRDIKGLAEQVKSCGCGFAIEHFGVGHRPLQILEHVPVDFIKVDGSLMEGLVRNREIQERVKLYIESAKAKNIETIAERVEDANTMAVLWQLGVEFIQGYYVQGPEEITLGEESA